ncbi:MAG: M1 family metallopeptidase [Alphaproteobacteria bacterium]|nr:M1 family metallopeptidase [Alphaproteobacteria bacterium]MBU2272018.1 M1 family metallopeptidase [Alphaproteobacteria bacterium]MBU2418937.1 M1 family metallopeptidase [Alphaproteobacteria bacterium]
MRKIFARTVVITSVLALLASATAAQDRNAPGGPESSAFTLETDQPRTPEQEAVRFDKADVAITVLPEDKAIRGVGVLDFTVLTPIDALMVELDALYDVSDVQVDGQAIPRERWSNPEGRMTIQLPRPLAAGEQTTLRIAYGGQPRTARRAPWDGGFVWSTAPGGEPWIATAVQLEGCDLIFPCIDNSNAEPGQVDLHVTVPSDLSAPGPGVFQGKTDNGDGTTTWNWSIKTPNIYAVNINVGPFEEVTADYRSRFGNVIPMHFWHLKSDRPEDVQRLFAEFPQMLDFFEATVGPYPFGDEKMGVVETPHLGMEHQTLNAYGNNYEISARGYDWLLQHEFAHEWFANQLTNWNADDMWLHEGLGSYMEPLYARWLRGERYMHRELADQRDGLMNRAPVVSRTPKTVDDVYNRPTGPGADIYAKGSVIAHTLRMTLGDEDFFEALRILVYGRPDPAPGNFRPVIRSTPAYNQIINEVTGRNYDWFFNAYLYEASLPVLKQSRDGDRLHLEWSTPAGVFPMPLEVEVDGQVQVLDMRDGRGFIDTPAGAIVIVDPENKVLRQLDEVDRLQAYRQTQRERRRAAQ